MKFSTLKATALAAMMLAGTATHAAQLNVQTIPDNNTVWKSLSGTVNVKFVDFSYIKFVNSTDETNQWIYISLFNDDQSYLNEDLRLCWDTESDAYNDFYFELPEAITAPGVYTVQIDPGLLMSGMADGSKPVYGTFDFVISADGEDPEGGSDVEPGTEVGLVVTPAPGQVVMLEYAEFKFVGHVVSLLDASLISFRGDDEEYEVTAYVPAFDQTCLVVARADEEVMRSPGTYTVELLPGSIAIDGVPYTQAIKAVYVIDASSQGNWTGEVTYSPEPGDIDRIDSVRLTYVGAALVTVGNDIERKDFPVFYPIGDDGQRGTPISCMTYASGNTLQVSPYQPITAEGEYELSVPAAYLFVDGTAPETEFTARYTIGGQGSDTGFDYTYTVTPDNTLPVSGEWLAITLDFEGVSALKNIGAWPNTPIVTRIDDDGNTLDRYAGTYKPLASAYVYTFGEWTRPDVAGTYKLFIPEAFIEMTSADGTQTRTNDPITLLFDYYPEGFDSLESSTLGSQTAPDAEVFTLSGVKAGSASSLTGLPAGIYIVNGKKVAVK